MYVQGNSNCRRAAAVLGASPAAAAPDGRHGRASGDHDFVDGHAMVTWAMVMVRCPDGKATSTALAAQHPDPPAKLTVSRAAFGMLITAVPGGLGCVVNRNPVSAGTTERDAADLEFGRPAHAD